MDAAKVSVSSQIVFDIWISILETFLLQSEENACVLLLGKIRAKFLEFE